jgi:hypothetical protein
MRSVGLLALAACVAVFGVSSLDASAQSGGAQPPAAWSPPNLDEQRAAIERLAPLVGRWQGEANLSSPHAAVVHQSERVERDLGGLVLVIHGTGHATAARTGEPVFQALGVISYDDRSDGYEIRSYANGYATTATGAFEQDGAFVWSINPGGPVRIRYTIRIDGDVWSETGEMSRDGGETWTQTISMSLNRVH